MKIVVLDDYQRVASTLAPWESLDAEVVFVHEHLTGALLVEALRETSVVVAMRERTSFDAALLGELTSLRLLVTTGAVNASIDVAAARGLGVIVCGTRSLASPAAELTWALILAVTRQVPLSDAGMRSGGWQTTLGTELAGKTLGLVGLGRLGQRVAKVGSRSRWRCSPGHSTSPSLADHPRHRPHPPPGLRHRWRLPGVLRRRGRGHPGLANRHPTPELSPTPVEPVETSYVEKQTQPHEGTRKIFKRVENPLWGKGLLAGVRLPRPSFRLAAGPSR